MKRIRRHLRVIEQQRGGDLEALCLHCGSCCYAAAEVNGVRVLVKTLRCKHLAFDGAGQSRCTVYAERHERAPWCQSLELAIDKGLLAHDCPYVATLTGYQGPVLLQAVEDRAVEAALREQHRGEPCPPWADPAAWSAFLEGEAR